MEFIKQLISFLINEFGIEKLSGLINILSENSFDIKKVLQSFSVEQFAPIIQEFMKGEEKNTTNENFVGGYGLSPIANIADKEIVYALNKYFYN
ncbi:MAG: hypothetical protein IKW33_04020 [Clostridia bacterium]|nr:hypothetical protein [Clostridia bacterium]